MEDVARIAGVSAITVSRVLRTPDKVNAETRARVAAAIGALGYVPNLAAGTLKSDRSGIVAAIVPTLQNSIFAETVQGLSDALSEEGYQLLIANSGYSTAAEESLVTAFLGRQPDGLVLTGVHHSPALATRLARIGLPVVETWDMTPAPIDMVVGFSNFEAARQMTHALAARGYRRIAFAGVAPESEWRSAQRQAGYMRALAELGLSPHVLTVTTTGLAIHGGAAVLAALPAREPGLDAVFYANDVLAFGGLTHCRRIGWQVPGDLAIAGFGDFEIARESIPALTTVRIPAFAIGQSAARMILDHLAGRTVAPRLLDLGFEIVMRESA